MAKQILRIEPIHTVKGFIAKYGHNYRTYDVPNADKSREKDNEELLKLPTGMTYNSFFEQKISESEWYQDHDIRKNAVLGVEFMLSFSTEDLPEDFSVEKWKECCLKWMENELPRENIASAVLHMDEGTPHIHMVLIPMKDGKLNNRALFGTREKMREMHTTFSKYMKECGLERGVEHASLPHEKIQKYYNNIGKVLDEEMPAARFRESARDYRERNTSWYQDMRLREEEALRDAAKYKEQARMLEENIAILREQHRRQFEEIGSFKEAKSALKFRKHLDEALDEYLSKKYDKATAESVKMLIRESVKHYEAKEKAIDKT